MTDSASEQISTEARRVTALQRYKILDTPIESDFEDIVHLAAETFGASIAVVNFVADDRQWFKAETGIGARELPLDVSICAHALLQDEMMVVRDARLDDRLTDNPLVTVDGGLRFYAGAQLRTADGIAIGTVCVLDRAPRPDGITAHQKLTLEVLARQVMALLDLRLAVAAQSARTQEIEAASERQAAAETARRASDDRYRALFESLDAGFCVVELAFDSAGTATDYRFIEVNNAFAEQTGIADARGRWMRSIAPDHEQHWFDLYGRVARTGEPLRFENAAAALDGRWYDVHAFRSGEPADRQVAILFTDITERRRAELELTDLNRTLDERVAQAIAEREEAQDALRQAQKLEAIGQLTGGVAHDFNNLLTVITGSVEMLRRPGLSDDRRKRYIDAIGDTAGRATTLTGQLLAFARRQALRPENFDCGRSLQSLLPMLRTLSGSRIAIKIDVADEDAVVRADRSQFDTAIVNMAINARDAMNGEGTLTITVEAVDQIPRVRRHDAVMGGFIAVTVADSGTGIAEADMARIFEPFFTTKEVGKGTGLGLSQVIGFAKQSGGEIRVVSAVGEGTSFTLYLPRIEDAAQADATLPTFDMIDGQEVCVLVVDDNEQVGEFATQALHELGYDSTRATTAAQALAKLAEDDHRFHAVFSDVVMPGMSGVEMAHEIRRLYPNIPVILTSGYSHILAENSDHGFELLRKPYSIEQLSIVLRKTLAAASA